MEQSDESLVAAYLAGDEAAFTSLVQRHLRSVYSFVARSVKDDAEDITQESFLKAWKHMKEYDPQRATVKTWLMHIVRNTVIDALRKRKSVTFSEIERMQDGDSFLDTADTEPLPDELVAQAHDATEIQQALEEVPHVYREVLLLRYMNQLTFEEMSTVLDEPLNTLKSRHRRGLIRLRHTLEALHQKAR